MTVSEKSRNAKKRWQVCAKIASHLGMDKFFVYNKLYAKLKSEGLLRQAASGHTRTLQTIRSWPEFTENGKLPAPKSVAQQVPQIKIDDALAVLKVTLWYVNKVGGLEKAKRLLEVVETLSGELEGLT